MRPGVLDQGRDMIKERAGQDPKCSQISVPDGEKPGTMYLERKTPRLNQVCACLWPSSVWKQLLWADLKTVEDIQTMSPLGLNGSYIYHQKNPAPLVKERQKLKLN